MAVIICNFYIYFSTIIIWSLLRLDDRHIRGSTNSDLKLPPDSDADSIQDYVDGEQAGKLALKIM